MQPLKPAQHATRILRLNQVQEITGLAKTTIYKLQAASAFPQRIKLTSRSVGWMEDEVLQWVANCLNSRPNIPGPGPPIGRGGEYSGSPRGQLKLGE